MRLSLILHHLLERIVHAIIYVSLLHWLWWRSILLRRRVAMLALHLLRGRFRFAGLIMAKVSDITLYTACTWAFLWNRRAVSHRTLCSTSSCIYWKGSYQIACHMLPRYKSNQLVPKICAYAHIPGERFFFFLNWEPMQDLRIGDNTHKLQERAPRSANVSETKQDKTGLEPFGWAWLAGVQLTVVNFSPLLRTLACAKGRRRLMGLRILPIAGSILVHGIGAYVMRVSIGLRQALLSR